MNPCDLMECHQRIQLICHAIRHLLDHAPEHVSCGDVEAIDILQCAINPEKDNFGSIYELVARVTHTQGDREAAAHLIEHDEVEYALYITAT